MRGKRLLVTLAIAGGTFGIATAVQASIPDGNAVVHSCYNTSLAHGSPIGAMRAIDTDKASSGGMCVPWEGAVDLATPTYVQNQIQSAIAGVLHSQFIYTDPTPLSFSGTGIAFIYWNCPGGWVATNATISIKSGQPTNTIVQIDSANLGSVQNGSYAADGQWLMHMAYTQANVQFYAQLQCVLANQVYGNALGAAQPNAATPRVPTIHVEFKPSA
jgi:hypothetical protein